MFRVRLHRCCACTGGATFGMRGRGSCAPHEKPVLVGGVDLRRWFWLVTAHGFETLRAMQKTPADRPCHVAVRNFRKSYVKLHARRVVTMMGSPGEETLGSWTGEDDEALELTSGAKRRRKCESRSGVTP